MGDIEVVNAPEILAERGDSIRVPRVRFDDRGHVVDTAGWHWRLSQRGSGGLITLGSKEYIHPESPDTLPMMATLPDGHWIIDRGRATAPEPHEFRVTRVDLVGDTVVHHVFRYLPVRFAEGRLDRAAAFSARRYVTSKHPGGMIILANSTPADSATVHAAIRARMDWPEFQTPIEYYRTGDDGSGTGMRRMIPPGGSSSCGWRSQCRTSTHVMPGSGSMSREHTRCPSVSDGEVVERSPCE